MISVPVEEVQSQEAYLDAGPYTDTSTFYIAAAWDEDDVYSSRVPPRFTVGVGLENITTATPPGAASVVTYRNAPLSSSTFYSIYVRYDLENEDDDAAVAGVSTSPGVLALT